MQQDELFHRDVQESKSSMVCHIRQEADQEKEKHIDMVNINSINFNTNHSIIKANPQTSSNKLVITVPYKVDTGSDGYIITLHIYKKLFSRETKENLAATRSTNI